MSEPAPSNRRRPGAKPRVFDTPAEPLPPSDEESPPPAPTATTVRPPGRTARFVKSRFFRSLELVAGAIMVLAASVGVAFGARRYILTSPRFAIRTVAVDGVRRRSAQEVARAGGLEVGKNVFTVDLENAGAMIKQDPWIEKATVTRKLPNMVNVTVVEREASALVAIGGELYLATRDGDLFKRAEGNDPSDLPLVTGILPEQVSRDRVGVVIAVKRALEVADDMDRAGISKRYPVEELHIERDGSLVATIGREALALHLGHAPFRDKIEQAQRVLNEVARRKANASILFLDNDAHPERVIVRMR